MIAKIRGFLFPEITEQMRYQELNAAFDELLACYLADHPLVPPSRVTAKDLMEWSFHKAYIPEALCEQPNR